MLHRKGKGNILHVLLHVRVGFAFAEHHAAVVFGRLAHLSGLLLPIEHHRHRSRAADLAIKGDGSTGKIICKTLPHKDIFQMELRLGEQFYGAEQAAHAPEVLIFQPEEKRYTCTVRVFSPGWTAAVMSNSAGVKVSSV